MRADEALEFEKRPILFRLQHARSNAQTEKLVSSLANQGYPANQTPTFARQSKDSQRIVMDPAGPLLVVVWSCHVALALSLIHDEDDFGSDLGA